MWKLAAALTLGVGAASTAAGFVLSLAHLINREGGWYSQGVIDLAAGCGLCVTVGVLCRLLASSPGTKPEDSRPDAGRGTPTAPPRD